MRWPFGYRDDWLYDRSLGPFQVTIGSALLAMLWVGIGLLAWRAENVDIQILAFCILILRVVPFFIAIGALFRRSLLGLAAGLLAFVVLIAGFFIWALHSVHSGPDSL